MEIDIYSKYSTVSINDSEAWNAIVKEAITYDIYHTSDYHNLEQTGQSILFVYRNEQTLIALPVIKRTIENSFYVDCTSVYGYAGPISNTLFENLDEQIIGDFIQSLLSFFEAENIVSVFCRLHPIINQQSVLHTMGGVHNNGKTVAIDLRSSLETQRLKYRRSIRQKVNQLRKKGFTVKVADTNAEIEEFIEIYFETMVKVNASASYFFDKEYFFGLLDAKDFDTKLILAYLDGKITSGLLLTFSNSIVQTHLAATRNEFLYEGPMKLLFDEATLIGREAGMDYVHLGGGVGGNEDSLFEFKAGFSDTFLEFNTWRYIANQSAYDQLVQEKCGEGDLTSTMFPLYRHAPSK